MKDSTDIKSESEIEVKEEVENGAIDTESQVTKILKTKTYCLLCQEYGHVINDNCVVNATCFSCGVKGHVRRDCYCLICQEPGHVLNDGCITCLGCGVRGHARRDCPSLLDKNLQIHDTGQKQPLSLQSQEHNPEVEILNDQNMECPPSLDTVNIIPKNDNTPATEYERGRQRDIDRRMYNLKMDAPCKFFLNKGCRFGISCRFKHDIERRKTEVESRSSQGRSRSRSPTDSTSEKTLVGAEAGPSDATTVECQGQGSSSRNQGGHHQPVPAYNAEKSDPPHKKSKDYTPEERQAIVREVAFDLIAPSDLAMKYKISAHSIKNWVKNAGHTLPTFYNTNITNLLPPTKFPPSLDTVNIPPKNGDGGMERDRDRRIHNHPGLPSEIEACIGANTALTSAKAGISDATIVECQGQRDSGNNQVEPHQPVTRQAIVREVVFDLIAPTVLARKYKISARAIRDWVKKAGHTLPTLYKTNITDIKFPPSLDTINIPPKNGNSGMERDRDRRIHTNQPGLPSEIVACVGANMALTDANAEKAFAEVKVVPVDATTVKCNEGGSSRNLGGHSINQTNNGPNKRDPQECHVCNKILYSFRTLNNHMRFEHGIFSETSSRISSW